MSWEILAVIGSIIFLIIALYKEIARPAMVLFMVVAFLIIVRILSPEEALTGFANKQLAVVVLLLIIGDILKKSTIIDSAFSKIMSIRDSPTRFLSKMTFNLGALSAFFNNTPLVALGIPYVLKWSKEQKLPASKFLIPLSYATIFGGCVTLIGTSTNLVVNGLAVEHGETSLGIFAFTPIGLPMLIIGTLYLIYVAPKLLPSIKNAMDDLVESSRQYFVETVVEENSPLIGKTVSKAGLRNLEGLFLIEIMRDDKIIRPVSSKEILQQNDRLFFAGGIEKIADITKQSLGLSIPKASGLEDIDTKDIAEVVISHNSKLAGLAIKETDFRGKYDGAILAVHRNGERIWGQLGNVVLKPGDILVVMTGEDFQTRVQSNPNFYLLSKIEQEKEVSFKRITTLLIGMFASIVLATTGVLDLFTCLLGLVIAALLLKVTNPKEIFNSIDFDLIVIIALGISLGKAMTNTGTDKLLADFIIDIGPTLGTAGILALLYFITSLLSALVTTKAAVAVTLPVSLKLGHMMLLPIEPFILVIAFAGAANFMTPIGYQTNLMVYGPGGYKFKDFFVVGWPITLLYWLVTVVGLMITYDL